LNMVLNTWMTIGKSTQLDYDENIALIIINNGLYYLKNCMNYGW